MANRFIDTNFFKSPFVRSLKGSLKGLYTFIICDCTGSGIWAADFEIASVYVGISVTKSEFEDAFVSCGKAVDLKDGKYFFPDFIIHQYPKGLSVNNPAHSNFILELQKYNLLDDALKPLERPSEGSKVKVKVIDKVKVKEEVTVSGLNFPFSSNEFMDAWGRLFNSKKWKKKSPAALQASLNKLSGHSEVDAIRMIENTIAGDWQGLFDLKPHERVKTAINENSLKSVLRKEIEERHNANN